MNHGLNNSFLYGACKLTSTFECSISGKKLVGSGTAFFVTNLRGELCLVTNRHNVDRSYKDVAGKYRDFRLVNLIVDNRQVETNRHLPTKVIELNIKNLDEFRYSEMYENDIACLVGIKTVGQQSTISFHIPHSIIADSSRINTKLSVCDFVAYPGFPDWYDRLNNNPILRTGTIASDPRFNYSNKVDTIGECIAYEAFSYGGSSGSPIFAIQKGFPVGGGLDSADGFYRPIMLVGINAGHLLVDGTDRHHSGISLMYKSSAILDIIDK